jgi:hypothetical protein
MAKRIRNRMELRDQFDAAERRKNEGDEVEEEVEERDEDADEEEDEGDEEAEEAPPPPKKKKAPAKETKPKRTRTTKVVRMKVVWKVYNNSNQPVATFEYSKRKEAEEHAAKLQAAKNPPQPFFVQPEKVAMDEK